jgi:hypothetical protein
VDDLELKRAVTITLDPKPNPSEQDAKLLAESSVSCPDRLDGEGGIGKGGLRLQEGTTAVHDEADDGARTWIAE